MIESIFMDLDNTIVHYNNKFIDYEIIYDWLTNCGVTEPEKIIFSNDWENLEKRLDFFGVDYKTFMSEWNPRFKISELNIKKQAIQKNEISLYDGVKDFIKRINIPLALVTNSSREVVDLILSHFNLNNSFDYVFTRNYDYIDLKKPDKKVSEIVIQKLGICKRNIVMIGDSRGDMDFSINSNLKFFNVHDRQIKSDYFFANFRSLYTYCLKKYPSIFKEDVYYVLY